jgi:hypothetical protein
VIHRLALRPGEEIRIEGTPDGQEYAPLDYVEIVRVGQAADVVPMRMGEKNGT